ncbi:probable glycosyltransferase At5g03795 [Asparagus officinalis]|uniref:probable glycosyltransferase At5g03795 n=1 Tax=Asparagus officinalis TaxID=4686 RepID=UPI00098E5D83|nr:probable glycosyltransferase At5g03795 [Asparagus officinalis]
MRDSPSSSSSSFWRSIARSSSTWVVVVVLVPLLVVSFVAFRFDSSSSTSWLSSSSSTSSSSSSSSNNINDSSSFVSSIRGEEEHENFHMDIVLEKEGGEHAKSALQNSSLDDQVSRVLMSPSASPSPAPENSGFSESSEAKVSHSKPKSVKRRDIKLERVELGLSRARAAIQEATRVPSFKSSIEDKDYVPQGPIYRNAYAFHRSYLEMEKLFRIYVYEEGEAPLFHDGPCKNIYSMEGRFIYAMEMGSKLRTKDPDRAHVFFLPFSVVEMVKFLYQPNTYDLRPLKRTIVDYINVVGGKYPYWNRSLGADHFMLSCHDWGPLASAASSYLYSNSIRVLCNANASEGFNPSKDVSLPEINLKTGVTTGLIGGPSASRRPLLAFFAGGVHGYIRSILVKQWQGKDEDVQVHQYLPKGVSYYDMMRKSKYCLCPSGYEVASPRIVEAVYLECVPVIISDNYVLPFSDVLNWKAFSVQIEVKDIPNIKKILSSISPRQYIRMQRRVKMVQRHFVINESPQRFDVFHMILHSIWLRRLNVRIQGSDYS